MEPGDGLNYLCGSFPAWNILLSSVLFCLLFLLLKHWDHISEANSSGSESMVLHGFLAATVGLNRPRIVSDIRKAWGRNVDRDIMESQKSRSPTPKSSATPRACRELSSHLHLLQFVRSERM